MTKTLEFYALTWAGQDRERVTIDDDMKEHKSYQYTIDVFGCTATGQTVCAHVGFTPYMFVGLEGVPDAKRRNYKQRLRECLGPQLVGCSVTQRRDFYGFCNGQAQDFLLCRFTSHRAMRKAALVATDAGLRLYESNVPPEIRVMHMRNLPSVGWVCCSDARTLSEAASTVCDIEFDCHFTSLNPVDPERSDAGAPLVVASFDIECVSSSGAFPDAANRGDPIIMIATTFWRVTEEQPYKRHLVCLGTCAPVDGVEVESFASEAALLLAWSQVLRREKADILLGYNIWGFDLKYIYERASTLGGVRTSATAQFLYGMGKRLNVLSEIRARKLESNAYGQNEFFIPGTPGVMQIDLLAVVKKEFKLSSYKLDAVAEHFLGERKVDLPIRRMFELFREGSPQALRQIAEYCVQDTVLPIRLLRKLALLQNMVQMCNACHIPFEWLATRGQQIKVFSVLLKKCREQGYVCPAKPLLASKDGKYVGATVLEAKVGAHMGIITCLDFASLYPSIIRAHNMCHSTIVLDEERYGSLPGVEYEVIDVGDGQPPVKFATSYQGSILPSLLADLAQYRKDARHAQKRAKEAGDVFLAEVYNGKQLAYKVTMNSLYGFCGAANGMLPCVPIAAAVTAVGRRMIACTKSKVEEAYAHLGAEVVYGDSVAGHTPVLVRSAATGAVRVVSIEQLAGRAAWRPIWRGAGKEACELNGTIEAWTEAGWTPVERIIRHRHTAPLVRVLTQAGAVDCTQHHSLLLQDGPTPIAPAKLTPRQQQAAASPLPPSAPGQRQLPQ